MRWVNLPATAAATLETNKLFTAVEHGREGRCCRRVDVCSNEGKLHIPGGNFREAAVVDTQPISLQH